MTTKYPRVTECNLEERKSQTVVCNIDGCLLTTRCFFPYFMLVTFEGGNILRAFLLLLSYPLLWILDYDLKLRVMIFITFCGLRVNGMDSVSRAVLPKFYLENLNRHVYEVLDSAGHKVVVTSVPRVMVEGFLKEYLSVDSVIGTELNTKGSYFTGLVSSSGFVVKHRALKEFFGEKRPDVGIGSTNLHDHLFISLCKESYVVNREDIKSSQMPRDKYPKPLIFHDGRLAFLPTPLATLFMFIWLPISIPLVIFRLFVARCLPYKISIPLIILSGVDLRIKGSARPKSQNHKGVLYVCNHRTLVDPVFLSAALNKPLTALIYSLSKLNEIFAPIKTVRLTRDREKDREKMQRLSSEGDLVVCPEGTTCREPYLLRFSSLFAEFSDEIVPVAMNTNVTMFYGNTASGLKCLDLIFLSLNPRLSYSMQVLEKVPEEFTCAGGKSSHDVANYIQRKLADALEFECTSLTRKDKYLILAGNEGVIQDKGRK